VGFYPHFFGRYILVDDFAFVFAAFGGTPPKAVAFLF
jgi:hypothetical protein